MPSPGGRANLQHNLDTLAQLRNKPGSKPSYDPDTGRFSIDEQGFLQPLIRTLWRDSVTSEEYFGEPIREIFAAARAKGSDFTQALAGLQSLRNSYTGEKLAILDAVIKDARLGKKKKEGGGLIPKTLSLTEQFKNKPKTFLETHVIVVDEHAQMDNQSRQEISQFTLVAADKNAVLLKFQTDSKGEFIKAYWLPWKTHEATSMDLGSDAYFFFTSELTNCRFSVLDPDPKKPKVAHVAGDLSTPTIRTQAEVGSGFVTKANQPLVRRLSISGSRDQRPYKQPVIPKKHEYTGQTGDPNNYSSAFVFGERGEDENWKFFAQIAKGSMVEGFFNHALTENLQILNYIQI
jgi:hypothetical protein